MGNSTGKSKIINNEKQGKNVKNKGKGRCKHVEDHIGKGNIRKKITTQTWGKKNRKVLEKEGRLKRYQQKVKTIRTKTGNSKTTKVNFYQQMGGDDTKKHTNNRIARETKQFFNWNMATKKKHNKKKTQNKQYKQKELESTWRRSEIGKYA